MRQARRDPAQATTEGDQRKACCDYPRPHPPLSNRKLTRDQAYEVTKEGSTPGDSKPAQISLTDCLACSGCVTSAEAVLISLQSHAEVLNNLDDPRGRIFVASVSPQVRASLAATYSISEQQAGWMIEQLLAGPQGLAAGGQNGQAFKWVVDTNVMREANLVLGAEELQDLVSGVAASGDDCNGTTASTVLQKPILSSACPGWVCYAEKTHPHVLPHLSRLKSPQALTGSVIKSILSRRLNIAPDRIWHLAIMPCFDKKLEASREELTDVYWRPEALQDSQPPTRDVDCVITTRELVMLADSRSVSFPNLPRRPVSEQERFPDPVFASAFFPPSYYRTRRRRKNQQRMEQVKDVGTSGGYLHHLLQTQLHQYPGSRLITSRGRNDDVIEYTIQLPSTLTSSSADLVTSSPSAQDPLFRAARYYGFRNIQNIVRKLKPPRTTRMPLNGKAGTRMLAGNARSRTSREPSATTSGLNLAYVEVMACPGGCTNGGGQIKLDDLAAQSPAAALDASDTPKRSQKEWLVRVDEAYFSMEEDTEEEKSSSPPSSTSTDGHAYLENHARIKAPQADHVLEPEISDGDITMKDADLSTDDSGHEDDREIAEEGDVLINGINVTRVRRMLDHWSQVTEIPLPKLVRTSFRQVHSDVGKTTAAFGPGGDNEAEAQQRVVELASKW